MTTQGGTAIARFAADQAAETDPCFFRGRALHPRATAQALRTLSQVVLTRFYTPPGMLQRILLAADPVVTAGREGLRFEGFSPCCSVYARLDCDASALEVESSHPGTTNVDFQAPMRAALAKVRDATPLELAVGPDAVEVTAGADTVIERKVPLPIRWIKGLGEVQAQLARMEHRLTAPRVEAVRFLRGLPKGNTRHTAWAVASGRGIRLTQREPRGGVRLAAPERLRLLEESALLARELRVYAEDRSGSSAWVIDLDGQRLVYVISPTRWRGFSGEGQLLDALAQEQADAVLARVQGALSWQERLEPATLAAELDAEPAVVERALALLAARGLVGYDLESRTYFHRVLPFDLSAVEALHPRLTDARKLVAAGGITIESDGDDLTASVPNKDVVHRVRLVADGSAATCTCPWYAKHQGDRGPCKHVLAAQMVAEGDVGDE